MTIDRDALAETLGAVSLIRKRGETRDFAHRLADAVLDAILPEVQADAEQVWRDGYYTGKRDYAGSITGGMPISTPNPYRKEATDE